MQSVTEGKRRVLSFSSKTKPSILNISLSRVHSIDCRMKGWELEYGNGLLEVAESSIPDLDLSRGRHSKLLSYLSL